MTPCGRFLARVCAAIYHRRLKLGFKVIYGDSVSVGRATSFRSGFRLIIDRGAQVRIGQKCFFNHNCSISSLSGVTIGDSVIFGEGVKIYDHNHRFRDAEPLIQDQGYALDNVVIEDNCWIGSNVVILKGVTIGAGSVIGAGCVLHQSIPRNSLVVNGSEPVVKPRIRP